MNPSTEFTSPWPHRGPFNLTAHPAGAVYPAAPGFLVLGFAEPEREAMYCPDTVDA
jgi:hypothetical protein